MDCSAGADRSAPGTVQLSAEGVAPHACVDGCFHVAITRHVECTGVGEFQDDPKVRGAANPERLCRAWKPSDFTNAWNPLEFPGNRQRDLTQKATVFQANDPNALGRQRCPPGRGPGHKVEVRLVARDRRRNHDAPAFHPRAGPAWILAGQDQGLVIDSVQGKPCEAADQDQQQDQGGTETVHGRGG